MATTCADARLPDIPVDMDDLLGRCLGRLDIVERILRTFHKTIRSDLEQLEAAVRASDAEEIAHIAHRMKGASLSIAAHDLQGCAERIETSAVSRQLENIETHFSRLKQECARFDNLGSNTLAT